MDLKGKLQHILDDGGIKNNHGLYMPALEELEIEKKEWRQLMREGLVEDRGFGRTLSIKGRLALLELKGINPWR